MSRTKDYLFDINHPCTWVKGNGSGLPRPKRFVLRSDKDSIVFLSSKEGVYVIMGNDEMLLPTHKARIVYKAYKNKGWS